MKLENLGSKGICCFVIFFASQFISWDYKRLCYFLSLRVISLWLKFKYVSIYFHRSSGILSFSLYHTQLYWLWIYWDLSYRRQPFLHIYSVNFLHIKLCIRLLFPKIAITLNWHHSWSSRKSFCILTVFFKERGFDIKGNLSLLVCTLCEWDHFWNFFCFPSKLSQIELDLTNRSLFLLCNDFHS